MSVVDASKIVGAVHQVRSGDGRLDGVTAHFVLNTPVNTYQNTFPIFLNANKSLTHFYNSPAEPAASQPVSVGVFAFGFYIKTIVLISIDLSSFFFF